MTVAGVAKELDTPVWMNRDGNICDEGSSLGCQVMHKIIHP